MTSIRSLARSLRTRDDGVALPTVFGLALVMLMFIAGAMTVSTRGIIKTNTDEDFNAALAAAYAGVEEYQSRLANDSNYQKFGNPAAPFSVSSAASLSLPTGANANPAFGIGATGTWANIPDAARRRHRGAVARLVPLRGRATRTTRTRASCTCASPAGSTR